MARLDDHQPRQELHVSFSSRVLSGHRESDDFILVHVVDVSERWRYEQRLTHLAGHDVLTGLVNRRKLDLAMDERLEGCRRYGYRGAMLLLDLDHFKEVNDTLGHNVGDQLIISMADILRRNLRAAISWPGSAATSSRCCCPRPTARGRDRGRPLVQRVRQHAAALDGVNRHIAPASGS